MHDRIFGWSYPPGCSGPPDCDDQPCDVCGESMEDCFCPECPECGTVGDPYCYINHGLKRTEEQKFSLECANRWWELETFRDNLWCKATAEMYEKENKEAEEYFLKLYQNQPVKE